MILGLCNSKDAESENDRVFPKLLVLLTSVVLILLMCSCDKYQYLKMNEEDLDYQVTLPYKEDFEDKDFQYVVNTASAFKWIINSTDGNCYLECVAYNESETIVGNNVHPILLGDIEWQDYEMSFDVKLDGDSYVMFSPFADSNNDLETALDDGNRNPWSLYLDSEGNLYYQTFLENYYLICNLYDSPKCFNKNDWNHITISHNDNDIVMAVNGVDIGKVADYNNEYYGRVSFGGTVGVKLDNIEIRKKVV